MNGDSIADLAVANYYVNKVSVLINRVVGDCRSPWLALLRPSTDAGMGCDDSDESSCDRSGDT